MLQHSSFYFKMLLLLVTILQVSVSWGRTLSLDQGLIPSFSGRIVGGQDATIEEFPYQAALVHFEIHRCGASIISPTAILTAAHCADGVYKPQFFVRVGTSYRGRGGILAEVRRITMHPSYKKALIIDYDIAVILLEKRLNFTDQIQPIALPAQNEVIPEGTVGFSSGWGRLSERGDVPTILQYIEVPIINISVCTESYGYKLTTNMVCAGSLTGGRDACKQDSGGPLVARDKQVGVISWAIGCGRRNYPGIYANVATFREWIDHVLEF